MTQNDTNIPKKEMGRTSTVVCLEFKGFVSKIVLTWLNLHFLFSSDYPARH